MPKWVRRIQRALTESHHGSMALNQVRMLTDFSEGMLHQFDQERYDPVLAVRELLHTLLRYPEQAAPGPTHAVVGHEQGEWITGFVYSATETGLIQDEEPIYIGIRSRYAVTQGREGVVCVNAPQGREGLDQFQQQFHPIVRTRIGCIRNYCTYRSGPIALILFNYQGEVDDHDAQVVKTLASHAYVLKTLADQMEAINQAFHYTVTALAHASEVNDEDTGNHIMRVGRYAERLAATVGQPERFVQTIGYAAQLHDVGKIHLDPHLLRKTGALTEEEWTLVKRHPLAGAVIVGEASRLAMAREIALTHHERWDGSGYPFGLQGEAIPLSGRITAVADVYDALRNPRCYKPALSHQQAMKIILEGDGRVGPSHFDPQILEAFAATAREFEAIYEMLRDEVPPVANCLDQST